MGKFMDKGAIIEAMKSRHGELEETLAGLRPEQMEEPVFEGGWSVKDILAHVSWWERRTAGRMKAWRLGEPVAKVGGNIDKINERVFEENRERGLEEVLSDFETSFKEILEELEAVTDEDLKDVALTPWTQGRPLRALIQEDGYRHYSEHARQIGRVLRADAC